MTTGADTAAWRNVRRVLAVRADSLGDVLMTSPALAAIRESSPAVHVTLLTSPGGAALMPHLDAVDEVLALDLPWVRSAAAADAAALAALVDRLAAGHYDAAVIFTTYTQSALPAALLCLQAGIGLRLAHCRENPYGLLSDWVQDPEPATTLRHEVQRQLALVAQVGWRTADSRLRFRLDDGDRALARHKMLAAGIDPAQPFVAMHPGASAPSRRYPPERYGQAARLLHAESGLPVVFTGAADERGLIQVARMHAGLGTQAIGLPGQLSLGELAALIADAAVLITNNSGPAHLAAALGTPVVDLYALTNPQHTPWRVPSRVLFHDVPCRFCFRSVCPQGHHRCLTGVDPAVVALAALQLVAARDARTPSTTAPLPLEMP